MSIKLTQYSKASGCGCKIAPSELREILKNSNDQSPFDNLIVGNQFNDDAAVLKLNEEFSIISTTDFFTPLVNDAFDFGKIAACNAISDIYAMGGKPLMAVAILGWPVNKLPNELAAQVINGAQQICNQAQIPLAGGHSIDAPEPFFGLAVSGQIKTSNIKKNHTIQNGDILYITKPLGIGILSSAIKRELITDAEYNEYLKLTTDLNKIGAVLGNCSFVNALTDVTGFGLVGHLYEMIKPSSFNVTVQKNKIPILESALKYGSQFVYPDNTTKNYNAYSSVIEGMKDLDMLFYCDPQTSGGLLVSVNANYKNEFENLLKSEHQFFSEIGYFSISEDSKIFFEG
jgi:selenide,water dikinase